LIEKRYGREEPDEIVVNFVTLLKKRNKQMRVLDLGCGAGRHQVYMAKQGFEAHGIDISETGLSLAKERLKRQNLVAFLVKADMKELPYMGSCFDVVVCFSAIYHQKLKSIQETISEIKRILKKNGLILANFLSKRTYIYGKGIKLEESTFIKQEGVEKGVLHYFTDEDGIRHLFKDFKIINLKLHEKEIKGKLSSRWILVAENNLKT